MPCTTKQDCPSNSTCCDGSDPNCAGTRLPSGEGVNPGEFVVSADSLTVTDTITGLVWQRDGLNCIGNYTWAEAEAYCASLALGGLSGWRLPAWAELLTILDFTTDTFSATIDQTAFPGTDTWSYWTSSLYTGLSFEPLYVSFDDGSSAYCSDSGLPVRCVRGSRCYPKARFVVIGGGLVRDMLTALVWQQQASVAKMTWADAQNYCSSLGEGFRLPTLKELDSLVDPTVTSGPSLDKTAFPNNGTGALWTSSPYRGVYASSSGDAHFGDFTKIEPYFCDNGFQNWISVVGSIQVRCVR
jgi:hypothetical protein